jgi:hypothetical protein
MLWHSDLRLQHGHRKDTETDGISIKLPDGRDSLTMTRDDGRRIARQLWDLGSYPGAASMAVKISGAVNASAVYLQPIDVTERANTGRHVKRSPTRNSTSPQIPEPAPQAGDAPNPSWRARAPDDGQSGVRTYPDQSHTLHELI